MIEEIFSETLTSFHRIGRRHVEHYRCERFVSHTEDVLSV